jgi:hypothetical protein
MINPVSSQPAAYMPSTQPAKAPPPPAAQPSQAQDSVQLSSKAQAALSKGDVDHDGDSH